MARTRELSEESSRRWCSFSRSRCSKNTRHSGSTEVPSDTAIYNRKKDLETVTGKYLAEKLKAEPWYKDIVPNVWLDLSEPILYAY